MTEPNLAEAFMFDDRVDDVIGMTRGDICRGTFEECLAKVWTLPDDIRRFTYITTGDRTYVPEEIEVMRREAEGAATKST